MQRHWYWRCAVLCKSGCKFNNGANNPPMEWQNYGKLANTALIHSNFPWSPQNSTSTERGCITTMREIRDCENDRSRCSLCPVTKDGACNTYDYPTARRRCVECRGGQQCASLLNTAISIDRASSFCENPSDACISINNRGNYTMACAATLTRYEQLFCAENPSSCTSCSSNNCIRLLPPPPEPINCPTTGSSATAVIHHAFLIGLGGLFLIV